MTNSTAIQALKAVVQETLDELNDLRASIEYDEEYMGGALIFLEQLEQGVGQLHKDIESGTYQLGEGELTFMDIAKNANPGLLPFKELFTQIQKIHSQKTE